MLLRRRVLVTGAAGLIGGELCGTLAERGHTVTALVHRNRRLVRADRSEVPTAPGAGPGRVVLVEVDLHRDDLGWSPERAEAMLSHDVVVHCAADTSLGAGAPDLRALNVEGTRRLLRWLAQGAPPLLVHVSTAYVCGARSGPVAEVPAPREGFNNAYEASKAEAERLVSTSGLAAVIARPSIVVGRWSDGALSRFDNVYGLIRLCGEGRLRELPAAAHSTLDLVPVDHVAGGLVDLVECAEQAAGRVVHLVSGSPVPVTALCALDVPGFHRPRLVPPATHGARGNFLALFAGYLSQDPRFSTDALASLSARRCPPTDRAFLRRLVEGACRAGFMRPNQVLLANSAIT